jgi:hypothetical protein
MEGRPLPDSQNVVPGNPPIEPRPGDESESDGELRVVVRKLKLPVRPRGVLAD